VHTAAGLAYKKSHEDLATNAGRAHAAVGFAAIRGRIDAIRRIEAARLEISQAEAAFAEATTLLSKAHSAGFPCLIHGVDRPISTEAAERHIWVDAGFDVENGTNRWLDQFKKETV
jgi:formate-dependent phosphoribosylglycinamide formyltransferase (GAR transformylase)